MEEDGERVVGVVKTKQGRKSKKDEGDLGEGRYCTWSCLRMGKCYLGASGN